MNHTVSTICVIGAGTMGQGIAYAGCLQGALDEKFRPCPLSVKYVKAGRLGKKVGKGVYEYAPDGTRGGKG